MRKRKNKVLKIAPLSFLVFILTAYLAGYATHDYIYYVYNALKSQPQALIQPLPNKDLQKYASKPKDLKSITHANCLIGCPSGTPVNNIFVDHEVIVLSSNRKTKFADWVAYKVTPYYITGPTRPRNWQKDPKIEVEYTFTPSDYKGMSLEPYFFDRGHQAPLASFKNHSKWYALNYLSNITPQKKELNRGAWKALESAERKLVQQYSTAYVLTGPYYDKNNIVQGPHIERMDYIVPSGYWKIIAIKSGNAIKTASFIFPQDTPPRDSHCKYLASIPHIQQITGLKFFDGEIPMKDSNLKTGVGCGIKEGLPHHG